MNNPGQTSVNVFWGEIAPAEHLVQMYADDRSLMDSLEGFISGGLKSGEAVIVIATPAHLDALEKQLTNCGFDLMAAQRADQYIALDAEEVLSQFMVNGWPDENRFKQVITAVLTRARKRGRRVRAFGEMVALLWAQGHCGATVRLEHLWESFCHSEKFPLFCAYPKSGFTENSSESFNHICAAHSKVIAG